MITQRQIDARDEYIKRLEYHRCGLECGHPSSTTLAEWGELREKSRQLIAEADREAAEMQSSDDEKLALWDEIKGMLFYLRHHKCRYECQCDNNTACMSCSHKIKVDNLIKRIETIGATTKDDTPEIKAKWDKAVERCAKGVLR